MKRAVAMLLLAAAHLYAHRLDEYLQATLISVDKNRVDAFVRLIPGIAVANAVISSIDTNGDGVISEAEQQAYAQRVLSDLSLSIDGRALKPRLKSVDFPAIEEMNQGIGEIKIEFAADLPQDGIHRKLVLDNHHEGRISAYLVNCLVARDKDIQIGTQNRNENQSHYELNYTQSDARPGIAVPLAMIGLVLLTRLWFLWRQQLCGARRRLPVSTNP
jgi:hypothetical protein